jgi:predicted nuclease of predicted toxin-antitoxin system
LKPSMRVLLDEGLPARAAALLRGDGIDAVHVTEVEALSTPDETVLQLARSTARVVVTLDADFHALLATSGAAAPSVIRIRRQGLGAQAVRELVTRLLRDYADALSAGAALSVRGHLVGIRRLPLTETRVPPTEPESDE